MKVFDNTKQMILTIALLGTFAGTLFAVDGRFAKADTVQTLSIRLDQKITKDQYHDVRARIWALEDRYEGKVMPEDIKIILRELRAELAEKQAELDSLVMKKK